MDPLVMPSRSIHGHASYRVVVDHVGQPTTDEEGWLPGTRPDEQMQAQPGTSGSALNASDVDADDATTLLTSAAVPVLAFSQGSSQEAMPQHMVERFMSDAGGGTCGVMDFIRT